MGTYIARRLAVMPFLLLGVITIVFVAARTTSADPITSLVPERLLGNEEVVAAARARWGLDKTAPDHPASKDAEIDFFHDHLIAPDRGDHFDLVQGLFEVVDEVVLVSNEGAISFWRALGYEDYALTLEITRPGV